MKIFFIEGYDHPRVLLEVDIPVAPHENDQVQIDDLVHDIVSVRHVWKSLGRGGQYEHYVKVQVENVTP
jgi:hypothetical protein